jgi:Mg2+ and Co2+ transporter CorA
MTTRSSTIDEVQQAIQELDLLRSHAGDDARKELDGVIDRLRDAVGELYRSTADDADAVEHLLDRSSEDVRREVGRRAIRAQRSVEALTELSGELRRCRAYLST